MNILITGATGFVGKNLIPYLIHHVERAECIPISVRYGDSLFTNAQVYIHLAGKAHDTRNTIEEKDYYEANYLLTKSVYDAFLNDPTSECFIYMSSVKAIADNPGDKIVNEDYEEMVKTLYGKSKKLAEDYILSNQYNGKRVYILRPCMIHGPSNKGNLNLLYKFIQKGIPYPLGAFENQRSFLSIENLCFVIQQLIQRRDIPNNIYHVADNSTISTKDLVRFIAETCGKNVRIWNLPKAFIQVIFYLGGFLSDKIGLPQLEKLTGTYIVSNHKLLADLKVSLPVTMKDGLKKTISSF